MVYCKEMYTCQYCTKTYTVKSVFVRHQNTSKKCLQLQEKAPNKVFTCNGCSSTFTLKQPYQKHLATCVPYVEIQLSEEYELQLLAKDEEICDLRKEIKKLRNELAKRPTIINNTTINKDCVIVSVTPELFQKHLPNLTNDHVDAGAFGMARYAADYPLKDAVKCKDLSRRVLTYQNEDGKAIKDQDGLRLTPAFFKENLPEVQSKITNLFMRYTATMSSDPEALGLQMTRLTDILSGVKAGARGEKTEFTQSWVKSFSSLMASK